MIFRTNFMKTLGDRHLLRLELIEKNDELNILKQYIIFITHQNFCENEKFGNLILIT